MRIWPGRLFSCPFRSLYVSYFVHPSILIFRILDFELMDNMVAFVT